MSTPTKSRIGVECGLDDPTGETIAAAIAAHPRLRVLPPGAPDPEVVIAADPERQGEHLKAVIAAMDRGADVVSLAPGLGEDADAATEITRGADRTGRRVLAVGPLPAVALEALAGTLSLSSLFIENSDVDADPATASGRIVIAGEPPIEALVDGIDAAAGAAVIARAIPLLSSVRPGLIGLADLPVLPQPGRVGALVEDPA